MGWDAIECWAEAGASMTFLRKISLALNLVLGASLLFTHQLHENAQNVRQASHDGAGTSSTHLHLPSMAPPTQSALRRPLDVRLSRLTDIVVPFHPKQESVILENMESWRTFPPCSTAKNLDRNEEEQSQESISSDLNEGLRSISRHHPAGLLGRNVSITFFSSSNEDALLKQRLIGAFEALPRKVRACFARVSVHFGELKKENDNYLTGSRIQFERLISGKLGLVDAKYVLYMEPDCLPMRSNWLVLLDALTRWPNPPFWMKGSIFRGDFSKYDNRRYHNLFHVNGNAIYNVKDGAFRHFYFTMLRPYINKFWPEGAYDTDFFKFFFEIANFEHSRKTAHLFQFTDAIQNLWHTNYSITELRAKSDIVVLVHGGFPQR